MIRKLVLCGAAIGTLALGSTAMAGTFPGYGTDPGGPGFIITLNPDGTATVAATAESPNYDGVEDAYVGVINNSGHTVNSVNLSAPSANDIFGFDSDGIDTYGAPTNAMDTTGYGGPDGYFTGITSAGGTDSGTVNFIGGIADGGQDYFSLEGALTATSFTATPGAVPEPATWAMMLLGFFGMGTMLRQRSKIAAYA